MVSTWRCRRFAIWLLVGFVAAKPAMACTTVLLSHGEEVVVAKNLARPATRLRAKS